MALKLKLKVAPKSEASSPRPEAVSKPKPEKLKKLKISLGKGAAPEPRRVPKVRIKPTRIPGEGYDSEAPDVEDDPLIEQAIVVRFAADANLDFLHHAADTGDFTNVNIKWITREKAVVNVNSALYSARLVDLPTLTEIYKTVDKKNVFKAVDVSQILLVLRPINPKQLNMEADFEVPDDLTYTHPLYTLSVNKEIRPTRTAYRHGLSGSFEDVYRRFRPKKTNLRLMTDVESRVDEIVRRDSEAQESHYEYVNPRTQVNKYRGETRAAPGSVSRDSTSLASTPLPRTDTEDVFGDEDDQMALDLEADLDTALEQELAEVLDSTSNNAAATVLMKSDFAADDNDDADDNVDDDDDDDEDDDDDDDDDDDNDNDEDESTKHDKSMVKKLEEEISDLQRAADKQKVLLATASYKMMRMKFQSAYGSLKAQLDQKKRELAKVREQQSKQTVPRQPNAEEMAPEQQEQDAEDAEEGEDLDDFQGLF